MSHAICIGAHRPPKYISITKAHNMYTVRNFQSDPVPNQNGSGRQVVAFCERTLAVEAVVAAYASTFSII